MIKRGKVGVAYRYTPETKINTLYGTEGVPRYHCRKCKESKVETDFYHENKNGVKVPMSICIPCDDERRLLDGKIQRRRDKGIHVDKNLELKPNLYDLELA